MKILVYLNDVQTDVKEQKNILSQENKQMIFSACRTGADVTAVLRGSDKLALREAISYGCVKGILIHENRKISLPYLLTQIIKQENCEAFITGYRVLDDNFGYIGSEISGLLGWPQISFVKEYCIRSGMFEVNRSMEQMAEIFKVNVPCVITVQQEKRDVPLRTIADIYRAFDKEFIELDADMQISLVKEDTTGDHFLRLIGEKKIQFRKECERYCCIPSEEDNSQIFSVKTVAERLKQVLYEKQR